MDSLTRLPLECLQHILQALDDADCVSSLAALLTMNKYIASVALPYIYRDPFRHSFCYNKQGENISKRPTTNTYNKTRRIACMLLKCLPPANLPTALSLGLAASQPTNNHTNTSTAITGNNNETEGFDTEYTPSPLDYFAHIRYVNLEPRFVEITYSHLGSLPLNSKVAEYIGNKEFDDIVRSCPVSPAYGQDWINISGVLDRCISTIFQHEVPWCLASPILGQLQSLTIHHTFSLRHFIGVVDRLRSL